MHRALHATRARQWRMIPLRVCFALVGSDVHVPCVCDCAAGSGDRLLVLLAIGAFVALELLLLRVRWLKWTRRITTARVRWMQARFLVVRAGTLTKRLTTSNATDAQVETARAREVVEQGTPLLPALLEPHEVLLWIGCTGSTKQRAQVEGERFCNCFTACATLLLGLTCAFTAFFLAGEPAWGTGLRRTAGSGLRPCIDTGCVHANWIHRHKEGYVYGAGGLCGVGWVHLDPHLVGVRPATVRPCVRAP